MASDVWLVNKACFVVSVFFKLGLAYSTIQRRHTKWCRQIRSHWPQTLCFRKDCEEDQQLARVKVGLKTV
uniref:Secreted protein n=1 Tax=Mesocestoides corti TaxID=53468 RepID=A0A5K3FYX6_MESCO